jgi:outer membrane protein TolC
VKASSESFLAAAEVERVRVTLQAELESRHRDVEVASVEVASLVADVGPAAAESLRIARLLFEEGETSLLDLLDAQRTARETRREEIRARYALANALNEMQRLLGSDLPEGRSKP